MGTIRSHSDLIDALGAPAVSTATGEKAGNVRAWKARNRIPPEHWPPVIDLADTVGVAIDADWLMRTTPPRGSAEAPEPPSAIPFSVSPHRIDVKLPDPAANRAAEKSVGETIGAGTIPPSPAPSFEMEAS